MGSRMVGQSESAKRILQYFEVNMLSRIPKPRSVSICAIQQYAKGSSYSKTNKIKQEVSSLVSYRCPAPLDIRTPFNSFITSKLKTKTRFSSNAQTDLSSKLTVEIPGGITSKLKMLLPDGLRLFTAAVLLGLQ